MLSSKLLSVRPNPTISFNGGYSATVNGSSVSISSINFGTATSDRIVAVYVSAAGGSSSRITSVTIAGVSATLAVTANTNAQIRVASIYYANIPTGTSGTVTVNFSITHSGVICRCNSYSLYNLVNSSPTTTGVSNNDATGVSPSASVTITPALNGVIVGGYNFGGAASGTVCTWTNLTEDYDTLFDSTNVVSTASKSDVENTSRTITATANDASVNRPSLIVAAWR
jgi:hypothetical protein